MMTVFIVQATLLGYGSIFAATPGNTLNLLKPETVASVDIVGVTNPGVLKDPTYRRR